MITRSTVLAIVLCLGGSPCQGQGDDQYAMNVLGGAGYSTYISTTPEFTSSTGGFSGTIRFMWKPEHRLSIGIESGYVYMYSVEATGVQTEFGPTDLFGARSSVPIILVFSMEIVENVQLTAGWGQLLVYGTTESFGSRVQSSSLSTGYMFAGSYFWPLSDLFEVGGEVKWHYSSKFEDAGLSFQAVGRWTFLRW